MSATIPPELRRAVIEIVDERFRELEVRRSDFIGLKEVVERLASAQVGTEEALKELAAAQKETDQSLKELAAAQKETEGTSGIGGGANADGSTSRAAWRQHRVWFRRHRSGRRARLFAASPRYQDGRV